MGLLDIPSGVPARDSSKNLFWKFFLKLWITADIPYRVLVGILTTDPPKIFLLKTAPWLPFVDSFRPLYGFLLEISPANPSVAHLRIITAD